MPASIIKTKPGLLRQWCGREKSPLLAVPGLGAAGHSCLFMGWHSSAPCLSLPVVSFSNSHEQFRSAREQSSGLNSGGCSTHSLTHRGPCRLYTKQSWAVQIDGHGSDAFLDNTSFFGEYFIFCMAGISSQINRYTSGGGEAFLL